MNNNKFELYGFVKGPSKTGFCIPIFYRPSKTVLYFQNVSLAKEDSIEGFSVIDAAFNQNEIVKLNSKNNLFLHNGNNPIFGFQLTVNDEESERTILIFDNRENLYRFFKYAFEKNLLKDEYLVEEILNLYKANPTILSLLKTHLYTKLEFENTLFLESKVDHARAGMISRNAKKKYTSTAATELKIDKFLSDYE